MIMYLLIILQRLEQFMLHVGGVEFRAGPALEGEHGLMNQQLDAADGLQAMAVGFAEEERPPGIIDEVIDDGFGVYAAKEAQVGELLAARHAEGGRVHDEVGLRRAAANGVRPEIDPPGVLGIARGKGLRAVDAAVADIDKARARLHERVGDGFARAARADDEGGLIRRIKAVGVQALDKAEPVGVVADGAAVLHADGVHRAAARRRAGEPVEIGDDGLFMRHGDVEAVPRAAARLLNKALQLLRTDGAEIIGRVEPGQLDHAAVQPRGETVFDGVADNAEMLHAGYSSIVNCASALRARSCRPQRRAPRGRRASCR